jgi:hypothetical protein
MNANDTTPIFCETACRYGGGRIRNMLKLSTGMDIWEAVVRLQTNIFNEADLNKLRDCNKESELAAYLALPPKKGCLIEIPEKLEFEWRHEYIRLKKVGDQLSSPVHCTDELASVVFIANSNKEFNEKNDSIVSWFNNKIIIK